MGHVCLSVLACVFCVCGFVCVHIKNGCLPLNNIVDVKLFL